MQKYIQQKTLNFLFGLLLEDLTKALFVPGEIACRQLAISPRSLPLRYAHLGPLVVRLEQPGFMVGIKRPRNGHFLPY